MIDEYKIESSMIVDDKQVQHHDLSFIIHFSQIRDSRIILKQAA
jgi:hypothetical protein